MLTNKVSRKLLHTVPFSFRVGKEEREVKLHRWDIEFQSLRMVMVVASVFIISEVVYML